MRSLRTTLVASLALLAAVFVDGCADVTLKASAPRQLAYGKEFHIRATVRGAAGKSRTSVSGLYLGIQVPEGIGFAGVSKSLPDDPVVWGANAENFYWPLPELKKRTTSFLIKLTVTGCYSAAQLETLPVSIFELDAGSNPICVESMSLQTNIRKASDKKCSPTETCANTGGWQTIAPFGQVVGSSIYGGYLAADGVTPIYDVVPLSDTTSPSAPGISLVNGYASTNRATRTVSGMPDAVTIFPQSNGKIYMLNNVEDYPSTMYLSELAQAADGTLTMTSTRGVASPLGASGPFAFLCAGSVTPWGTKLVGEEFTWDARVTTNTYGNQNIKRLGRAAGWYYDTAGSALPTPPLVGNIDIAADKASAESQFKPYNYGSIVEAKVAADGGVTTTKLWTMGRLNHELALVLPDRRTVLTTDDISANGIIIMFVADIAGDLTSGELFAPRFTNQVGPTNTATGAGAEWDINWISLGRGTQAQLEAMRPTLTFASIFDTATCTVASNIPSCPAGFTRVANSAYTVSSMYCECLKLKPGMERAAAFFETRRYASMLGASVEFSKGEGITYSEELQKVYIALTRFKLGALDGATTTPPYRYDLIGHDDIRLPDNSCGGILELDVNISNLWLPTHARMMLAGVPQAADAQGNTCDVNNIASPDNVMVIPGTSTMLIQEDCANHVNCVMWTIDLLQKAPYQEKWPANPTLTRVLSSPTGAENTGAWYATIGKYMYLTMGHQHATVAPAGFVGHMGPVPVSLTAPREGFSPKSIGSLKRWKYDGIAVQTGTANQDIAYASSRLCIV